MDIRSQWIFPGIEQTPGICGGNARIKNTRIPVWVLVRYLQLGVDEATLLSMYPTLGVDDLRNAKDYYSFHPGMINHQIEENEIG